MVVANFSTIDEKIVRPSPSSLLEATPPVLVYALSAAYPLLSFCDRVLGWLTWTSPDQYESVLMVVGFCILYRNFDTIISLWLPTAFVIALVLLIRQQTHPATDPPTLEEIIKKLEGSSKKYQILVSPLQNLDLSGSELVKLVLATLFLSPVYIIITFFLLTPCRIGFISGLVVLTWHSMWSKVFRSVLWRFQITRNLVFLLTGLDRSTRHAGNGHTESSLSTHQSSLKRSLSQSSLTNAEKVTFTFVVFENQRNWLGVGWTPNLLAEERAPWTDPSLSEVHSIDAFELPDSEGTGMIWKWVDKDWQLDITNGGMLTDDRKPDAEKLVMRDQVDDNMGYVYYSSFWTAPSPFSGFSKYTRRRRWVRKAALVDASPRD